MKNQILASGLCREALDGQNKGEKILEALEALHQYVFNLKNLVDEDEEVDEMLDTLSTEILIARIDVKRAIGK